MRCLQCAPDCQPLLSCQHPSLFLIQQRLGFRRLFQGRLGDDRSARRTLLRQVDGASQPVTGIDIACVQIFARQPREILIGTTACFGRSFCNRLQRRVVQGAVGQRFRHDVGRGHAGVHLLARPGRLHRPVDIAAGPLPERLALLHQLVERLVDLGIGRHLEQCREPRRARLPGDGRLHRFMLHRGNGLASRRRQQACLPVLLQHPEVAGDIGFQRKLVQQRFAERMDGLDLETARSVERQCEQRPGAAYQRLVRHLVRKLRQHLGQFHVIERNPFAQLGENAVGHLGGCGIGKGQAQQPGRVVAVEQQADDAPRQHEGLARSRIGRHPYRQGRVAGCCLLQPGIERDFDDLIHWRHPARRWTIRAPAPDGRSCRRSRFP